MKKGEEARFVSKSLSHVGGSNIGNGGRVLDSLWQFTKNKRGHSEDERSKRAQGTKSLRWTLKRKLESRLEEEGRAMTLYTETQGIGMENRQEAGMCDVLRDAIRSDGEARQLLRSAACCLPVLELISLNRALLQAIGLLM